jgi:hypothetical protein
MCIQSQIVVAAKIQQRLPGDLKVTTLAALNDNARSRQILFTSFAMQSSESVFERHDEN